jgi:hypothetical protein
MLLRTVCEMPKSNRCETQGIGVSLDNGGLDAKFGSDRTIGLSTIPGVYPSHNIDVIDFSSAFSPRCRTFLL